MKSWKDSTGTEYFRSEAEYFVVNEMIMFFPSGE